jgi:hypothetical protein
MITWPTAGAAAIRTAATATAYPIRMSASVVLCTS